MQQQKRIEAIQLPKTELQTFDGDPLKYWIFLRSFENTVDKQTVDTNAKLTRLLQYCTGKARKVIQCCSVIEPELGYIKAKSLLRERFDNDYVIVEAWIQKISGGTSLESSDRVALQDFSDDLKNCYETLSAMDKLSEIGNQRSLVQIIQKLPVYLQNQWRKKAHFIFKSIGKVHFKDVVDFVQEAAKVANDPVFGNIADGQKDRPQTLHKNKLVRRDRPLSSFNTQSDRHHYTAQPNSIDNRSKNDRSCPLCESSRTLFGCDAFKMRVENRLKLVHEKRLCYNCLLPGHYAFRCNKEATCTVAGCRRKHTRFLHVPNINVYRAGDADNKINAPVMKTDSHASTAGQAQNGYVDSVECNVTGARNRSNITNKIALPIVPVRFNTLHGDHFVDMFALLDSGSTNTFCSAKLVNKLGIHGIKEELSLTILEKECSVTDTTVVSLVVADKDSQNNIDIPRVYVRPRLPIHFDSILTTEEIDGWPHLHGLELPESNAVNRTRCSRCSCTH